MLRRLAAAIILLLCAQVSFAQLTPVISCQATLKGNIHLLQEQLSVSGTSDKPECGELENVSAELVDGEIAVLYELPAKYPSEETTTDVTVHALVIIDGDTLSIRPDRFIGDYGSGISILAGSRKKFYITRLLSDYVDINGEIEIVITVARSFRVSFDCESRPQFGFNQKVAHYGIGLLGAGAIVGGVLLDQESQKKYDEYLGQTDQEVAKSIYDQANSQHKLANALIYSGAGIIAADIIWYIIRHKKHKKRSMMFDKYCNDGAVSVQPSIQLPGAGNPAGSVGLSYYYKF